MSNRDSRVLTFLLLTVGAVVALAVRPTAAFVPLRVVATTEDMASLAREVGGDRVSVEAIARGYQDPHFVEAKPSFILKFSRADLLIVVGRDLEIGWLPPLITNSRNAKIQVGASGYLDPSAGVKILELPTGQLTRAMGDVHPQGNPHYWLDPGNGRMIARAIRDRLTEIDRAGQAIYAQRYDDFDKRLATAERRWDAAMAPYKGTKIVTYHRSWPNFTDRFGLDVIGYVEPKPGVPPSPSHTIDLIEEMKHQQVRVILMEPYFDEKTPRQIGTQTGAKVLTMAPSVGGVPGADDYIKLFDYNVNLLATTLAQTGGSPLMDWTILQFLAPAIVASLIIAGIHAYLGLHVVERGVIFVDLSLAQIASLGATLALLIPAFGGDPHHPGVYWTSLGFTFVGAAIFSVVKGQSARVPQEAIIGISYAVASAAVIVAMSQSTGESEHLRDMLVGNILSVSWDEVWKTAGIYVVIGAFHYIFRKRFLQISMNPAAAEASGISVRFWDFLFYASFGVVVTRSVAIAGVLLVFCYLIVPSVAGMLFAERVGPRLTIGWIMGVATSMLGMYFSVLFDLPTGATIVCTLGAALVLMAAVRPLFRRA